MTLPVPYESYADELQADVNRIRQDWSNGVGRVLLHTIVPGALALALAVILTATSTSGFVPAWIGQLLFVALLVVLFLKLGVQWKKTASSIVRSCFKETFVNCPHCQKDIDLTQSWQCGWCNLVNNQNMLISPCLVFDGCSHKGRHRPNAVKCPHCTNDIVRDQTSYANEWKANRQDIEGVAEFVADAQVLRPRGTIKPMTMR